MCEIEGWLCRKEAASHSCSCSAWHRAAVPALPAPLPSQPALTPRLAAAPPFPPTPTQRGERRRQRAHAAAERGGCRHLPGRPPHAPHPNQPPLDRRVPVSCLLAASVAAGQGPTQPTWLACRPWARARRVLRKAWPVSWRLRRAAPLPPLSPHSAPPDRPPLHPPIPRSVPGQFVAVRYCAASSSASSLDDCADVRVAGRLQVCWAAVAGAGGVQQSHCLGCAGLPSAARLVQVQASLAPYPTHAHTHPPPPPTTRSAWRRHPTRRAATRRCWTPRWWSCWSAAAATPTSGGWRS